MGVYYLIAKQGNLKSVSTQSIFFVIWDSGKIERIASEDKTPAYIMGGIIDLDLDGVQELISGTSVGPDREDGDDGLQIDILRYGPSGWTSVYRPKWICGPSCSEIYNFIDYGRRRNE